MKRFLPVVMLLLVSCRQEITSNGYDPGSALPSSAVATQTVQVEPTPTMIPPTSTPASFPPPEKLPEGPVGIVAMGDSLTVGEGDQNSSGYTLRLLENVLQVRPGSSLSNYGQSTWDSDALVNGDEGRFGQLPLAVDEIRVIRSLERGAVVLLWTGSIDLWNLYQTAGEVTPAQEQQDAERFASNMTSLLVFLRSEDARVVVGLLDDQSKRPAAISGEAFPNITPAELEQMSAQVRRYNEIIIARSEQYGALTVDFYNTTLFTDPAMLSADGIHPNQAGYELIAEIWYEVLSPLLIPGG